MRAPKPHRESPPVTGGVGAPLKHDSGPKHVTGEAVYTDDIPEPPGTLQIYLAMSERAHAAVTSLDVGKVRTAPGVAIVLTAKDVPGVNDVSPFAGDDPLFADGLVEYWGQSLFAVAAETMAQARAAARLAVVAYEDRPAILTIAQALAANSLLEPPYTMQRGDAKAAIATAPRTLTGRIAIGGQEHFYLEGQVALALPGEDDDVTVHASTQHPSEIQHKIAQVLGVASHAVTVEVRRMGGAFGGKESQGNLPAAVSALVAKLTGRPAKCCYDRDDDMIITGKRHDFRIDYCVGFDERGRILGIEFDQAVRCGMSFDLSSPIADRAMFHADNAYYLPAVRITSHRCKTHTQSNTAFRGFGGPQGMIAMERVIEEIAHDLDIDPLSVRRINFYDHKDATPAVPRNLTPYQQSVEDCIIQDIVAALETSSDYATRRAQIRAWNASSPFLKRGIALTPVKFGISFTNTMMNQAGALVHVYSDGSIHLNHGGTEMGQGLFTKVAQVVAEEFQVDIDRIKITATTTAQVPNTSPTAASSGSDLNGMAARNAAAKIKGRIARFLAERHQADPGEVVFLANRVRVKQHEISFDAAVGEAYRARIPLSATGFYATPKIRWDRAAGKGRPFYYFCYGAAVCEVVVDSLTGENRILRTDILHDVGQSLNCAIDLGQIEGGFVQGAGWLTTEELVWDDKGRLSTHAPSTYKIPACSDRPLDMRIALWDKGRNAEETIYRSKAVGEPPLMLGIAVFMALNDAVASVEDYQVYPALDAPATPECLLMAMERISGTRTASSC
jgi:xanthine dehydrogenase large subunit